MTRRGHVTLDPSDAAGWARLERLGRRMLGDVFGHLRTLREQPAYRPMPDAVRRRIRGASLPRKGEPLEAIYQDFLRDVLPHAGGNLHPRFWGWVMGNGTPGGVLAELLAAGMNANLWGGSQGAVEVESKVIDWSKQLMGFPEGASGVLVSGCSLANLIGLAAARSRLEGGRVGGAGLRGLRRTPVVYVSAEAHNSLDKAVDLLGIGREQLRKIPVDPAFAMDTGALCAQLARDVAEGFSPMAVVATAGTVATGAIDPLREIADICREHGVWMHVDGAFGALAMLDPEAAPLLDGLSLADSLAFDFHKWLSVPYEAACVLVRDRADHARTFESKTAYLSSATAGPGSGPIWFCDLGPELSRGFRGLKVWMSLREHGADKLGRLIRQNVEQARELAARVDAHPELELLAPVSLNVVCFRYRGDAGFDEAGRERLNQQALARLQERGIAVPSHCRVRGRFSLRAAFVNHRTGPGDVAALVDAFVAACHDLAPRSVASPHPAP